MVHPGQSFQPQAPADVWAALLADVPRFAYADIAKLIDTHDPPSFFHLAEEALSQDRPAGKPGIVSRVLLDHGILLRAIADPTVIELGEARRLTRLAIEMAPNLDASLLQRISAPHRVWPEEVPEDEALRVLELVEVCGRLDRLALPILKFTQHPHHWVRSKGAKLFSLGAPSAGMFERLFEDNDPRVKANLIEGLARRPEPLSPPFVRFVRKASSHTNPRVFSLTQLALAKSGDAEARFNLEHMRQQSNPYLSKPAEWAWQKLAPAAESSSPESGQPGGSADQ
jgi:hypothetical protein